MIGILARPLALARTLAALTLALGALVFPTHAPTASVTEPPPTVVRAGERLALVVGNAAYSSSPLVNPTNDARAMSELLKRAGFQVDLHTDTSRTDLVQAIARFGQAVRDPKVRFAVFYYAGHGFQQDWRNYLVPVDAKVRVSADVPKQTVDVSELLRTLNESRGRSYLVILDACRDDPFAGGYRPPAKGLSQFDAPSGSLLAYATAPGRLAFDGEGQNGLYTKHLVRELATPDATLEEAFKRVRLNVRMESGGKQIPWESTSLEENVSLFPNKRGKLSDTELERMLDQELAAWSRVRSSNSIPGLVEFLRAYPSGNTSELAQARLNRLLAEAAERDDGARRAAARKQAEEAEALRAKAEAEERERQRVAQAEAAKAAAEREEAARRAAAEAESVRVAKEQAEREKRERDRLEAQRLAQEKLANEQRNEAARVEAARKEAQRLEALRRESEQRAAANAEAARVAEARAAEAEARRRRAEQEATAIAQAQAARAEAAKREIERLTAAAQARRREVTEQAPVTVASLAPTPYFSGLNEHRRDYRVGDVYEIRVVDLFTKATKPQVMRVTAVDEANDRVEYNGGEFSSDLMGNTVSNQVGSMSTPRQFYPSELTVGKRWTTMFKQARRSGLTYTFRYEVKVAAKETITVPAGTFEAYRIEARGFNMDLGAQVNRNIWVTPGVNADIAHEIYVRLRTGQIEQNDRQELVSVTRR